MSVVDFSKLYPDNRQEGETVLRQAQLVMLRMLKSPSRGLGDVYKRQVEDA